jgi:hypothetical protein
MHVEDRLPFIAAKRLRLRPIAMRDRRPPRRCRAVPVPTVVARLRRADGLARLSYGDQAAASSATA